MLIDWLWLFVIGATFADVDSLPTSSLIAPTTADEAKKSEQLTEELKGTLSNSGLDDVLTESEQQQQQKKLTLTNKQSNTDYIAKQQTDDLPSRERNYVYGKVLVNEMGDTLPRGVWYLPSTSDRYYNEDRRKRSEDSTQQPSSASSTVSSPSSQAESSSSSQAELSSSISQLQHQQQQLQQQQQQQQAAAFLTQPMRSRSTYYQEPRYKRESDFDPEDFLALLSLYDEDRRNRQNWRNYDNEEYESIDDDINMIGIDEEDPRGVWWLENPMIGYPSCCGGSSDPVLDSELAALNRARLNYYDPYLQGQYVNSINNVQQQYDSGVQYGAPQYDLPYVQNAYYPPEKRFMVSRKRSQNYDTYGARGGLLLNSRGYPNYQHRFLY